MIFVFITKIFYIRKITYINNEKNLMLHKKSLTGFKLGRKEWKREIASRRFTTPTDNVAYLTARCLACIYFLPG
jgi:hypothetical protein